MLIPKKFTDEGVLSPGDYPATLQQLRESMLVRGPSNAAPEWDSEWRGKLVDSLAVLVGQLWQVGIKNVFVDGSFVEDKNHPNDIDGYFDVDLKYFANGDVERALNLIDPHKVWTWASSKRMPVAGFPKKQLPMWHRYRVELYPHFNQRSGIVDARGNELDFPAAFRQSRRDGTPKGIIQLLKSDSG